MARSIKDSRHRNVAILRTKDIANGMRIASMLTEMVS